MTKYPVSCEVAYAVCLKAVSKSGYGLRQTTSPSFLEVQTNERLKGWDGILSVIITPEGSGCEISINAATTSMSNGKVGQFAKLSAFGLSGYAEGKLADLIEKAMKSAPRESIKATNPQETKPSSSTIDELMKLKDLLDSGVLTQQEFDVMKNRLIG